MMTPPKPPAGCCAIVLAAGRATRFGGNKLLAPFRGAPLLAYPLRILDQARHEGLITRTIAVVRPDPGIMAELARINGADPVLQLDPHAGQGRSLRMGLDAAKGWDSAMVVLGDQPLLRIEAIRAVLATAARHPDALVRARYTEAPTTPGHPVVIPSAWWHLAEAEGGFRHAGGAVEALIPGDNPDVDTPDDLRVLGNGPD